MDDTFEKFKFSDLKAQIVLMKDTLPKLLANQAQNYFVASFDKQGFDGKKWQQVKRRIPGTPEYKYPKDLDLSRRTRFILLGKGATKLRPAVNNCIRQQTWPIVQLVVDLPYAKAHNEGVPTRNLPKRQFMGWTQELRDMQRALVLREYAKLKLGS